MLLKLRGVEAGFAVRLAFAFAAVEPAALLAHPDPRVLVELGVVVEAELLADALIPRLERLGVLHRPRPLHQRREVLGVHLVEALDLEYGSHVSRNCLCSWKPRVTSASLCFSASITRGASSAGTFAA
jgi:hypothetical protein